MYIQMIPKTFRLSDFSGNFTKWLTPRNIRIIKFQTWMPVPKKKTHRHFHNLNYFRAWWHTCLLLHLIVFVCRTCIHQYKGKTEIYRHLQLFWCIIATHRWLNLTLAFYYYNTCYFLLRGCHYLKQENLFQRLWLYLD